MTIRKQFDESEIFWHLLFLLADGKFWSNLSIVFHLVVRPAFLHLQSYCSVSLSSGLIFLVPHVLHNCLPIIHGLFSSILKFWEQCREPKTSACPSQLYTSVQIMSILRKAMWLPRPLCLVGDIFHIISPKEIHKLLETIWEFFKVGSFVMS